MSKCPDTDNRDSDNWEPTVLIFNPNLIIYPTQNLKSINVRKFSGNNEIKKLNALIFTFSNMDATPFPQQPSNSQFSQREKLAWKEVWLFACTSFLRSRSYLSSALYNSPPVLVACPVAQTPLEHHLCRQTPCPERNGASKKEDKKRDHTEGTRHGSIHVSFKTWTMSKNKPLRGDGSELVGRLASRDEVEGGAWCQRMDCQLAALSPWSSSQPLLTTNKRFVPLINTAAIYQARSRTIHLAGGKCLH